MIHRVGPKKGGTDRALYLDGDTLVLGDVCEVFGCCDETKLIVGSRDPENFNLGPDTETPWLREKLNKLLRDFVWLWWRFEGEVGVGSGSEDLLPPNKKTAN